MKKLHFVLVSVIIGVFLFFSCGELNDSEWDIGSLNLNKTNENNNLLEKYGITILARMWNDYMPGGGWQLTPKGERASLFCIEFFSPDKLPSMEVFTTIITERTTMRPLLYEIYGGNGTVGKGTDGNIYSKDFRPKNGIRLNDGEEYNLEIIVKINGEHQIITFENLKVYTTM